MDPFQPAPSAAGRLSWILFILFTAAGLILFFAEQSRQRQKMRTLNAAAELQKSRVDQLTHISSPLEPSLPVTEALLEKLRDLKRITAAHRIQAYLFDVQQDFLFAVSEEEDAKVMQAFKHLPKSYGRLDQVSQSLKPNFVEDLRNPPPNVMVPAELLEDGNLSSIVTPLLASGEIIGYVAFLFDHIQKWDDETIAYYSTIGKLIGASLKAAKNSETLRELYILRERNYLSQDLHDNFSQLTSALTMRAEAARLSCEEGDYPRAQRDLEHIIDATHEIQSILRDEMIGLRNQVNETRDLIPQIQECIERFKSLSNIYVILDLSGAAGPVLVPAWVGSQYLYILHEGLSNVRRHSGASQVIVRVDQDRHHVGLEIIDNGRGVDLSKVSPDRLGLQVMQERARDVGGQVSFEALEQGGFMIQLELPIRG